MSNKFVHTHLHTEFSQLDGINKVDTLPTYVRDTLGQDTVSITDHGTMAGSYKFFKSCNKADVKPIIGMEAYYAVGDRTVREADHLGSRYHHMVLLSKNNTGLHNLYKLSTASFTTGMYYKPRIDDTLLADLSEGLMATSACLGSYSSQLILKGENAAAEKLLDHHAAMFKDNFFIEVQLHADKQQQTVNAVLLDIAKRKNYPLLLTNDCLLPGQPIMTIDGAKAVEDIQVEDLVLTHKGRYRKVIIPINRQVDESVYSLRLRQTTQFVTMTGEHPVQVSNKKGITSWKKAKELSIGDYATFPRQQLSEQTILGYKLDSDLAWLLGWFTAEGSTWLDPKHIRRYGFNFALGLHELDIAERIQKLVSLKFGYEPKLHIRKNWIEVRGYNAHISQYFASCCGIGSRNKFIHYNIQKSNHLETYLQALFQGDGTATKTSQLATASFSLAHGVKQALASIGHWGMASFIGRKCQTGIFDQWLISWTASTTPAKWLVFKDFLAREIKELKVEHYVGPVYNFEVEEDNTYVSNVTVHNCHYTHEADKQLHEQSLCMQTGAVMSDPPYNHDIAKDIKQGKTRFSFGEIDVHVAHHDWMWKHAQEQGIPYEAISNTVALAASVNNDDYFSDRRNRYPKFQNLPEGMPPWTALNKLAHSQLLKKFSGSPPPGYITRLNSELKVIKKMGFYDYLLIVKQFLDGARSLDVLVGPGRGSVAGSLVAFVMEITEIDPIKYGLVFER